MFCDSAQSLSPRFPFRGERSGVVCGRLPHAAGGEGAATGTPREYVSGVGGGFGL
jgi:hypothetical protein